MLLPSAHLRQFFGQVALSAVVGLVAHRKASALALLLRERSMRSQRPIGRVRHLRLVAVKATIGADQPLWTVMAQLASPLLTASEGRMALSPIGRVVFGARPEQLSPLRTPSPMAFIATHPLCPTITQRINSQRMALEAKMGVSAPFPLVGIIGDTDPMTSAPQPIWWVGHCRAVTSVTFLRLLRVATSASLSPLMPLDAVRHRHPFVQLATLIPMPKFLMAAIATEGRADSVGVTSHADAVSPQPVRFVLLRQPLFVFCHHHMGF
jgi:hypothetical protein